MYDWWKCRTDKTLSVRNLVRALQNKAEQFGHNTDVIDGDLTFTAGG